MTNRQYTYSSSTPQSEPTSAARSEAVAGDVAAFLKTGGKITRIKSPVAADPRSPVAAFATSGKLI